MDRRGFLQAILAAGVAPAFIDSSVLMPVRTLWTPPIDLHFPSFQFGGVEKITAPRALWDGVFKVSNDGPCDLTIVGFHGFDGYQDVGSVIIKPGETRLFRSTSNSDQEEK